MQIQSNSSILSDFYKNSQSNKKEQGGIDHQLVELQSRDQEVRIHEAAHQAGGLAGAASYSYQQGSDGKMYAIGGEVSIDTSEGSTPEETIQKATQIQAAALAPADPSSQDMKVAANASAMLVKAQLELAVLQREEKENVGQKTYAEQSLKLS